MVRLRAVDVAAELIVPNQFIVDYHAHNLDGMGCMYEEACYSLSLHLILKDTRNVFWMPFKNLKKRMGQGIIRLLLLQCYKFNF